MVPNQPNWMTSSFYPPTEPSYPVPPLPVQHHAPPPPPTVAPAYSLPAPVVHATPMPPTTAQDFFTSPVAQTEPVIHTEVLGFGHGSNFRGSDFRPSKHMYTQEVAGATSRNIDFQTAQFRKYVPTLPQWQHIRNTRMLIFENSSHFNTSHFLNPDFHPDEWSPDQDYITPNNRNKHKPSK